MAWNPFIKFGQYNLKYVGHYSGQAVSVISRTSPFGAYLSELQLSAWGEWMGEATPQYHYTYEATYLKSTTIIRASDPMGTQSGYYDIVGKNLANNYKSWSYRDGGEWVGVYLWVSLTESSFNRNVRIAYGRTGQSGSQTEYCACCFTVDGDDLHTYLCFATVNHNPPSYNEVSIGRQAFDLTAMEEAGITGIIIRDPNDQGGTSSEQDPGGDGDFDLTSDQIDIPDPDDPDPNNIMGLVATNAGFVTLYKVTEARLKLLADEMYSTNAAQAIKTFFVGGIMDAIAGLGLLPFTPDAGSYVYPKFGPYTFTVSLQPVTKQFKRIDMGSIKINEYWGNYLDYSPNTRIIIYLPFVGYRELDVDEIMGKTIGVQYNCDSYSGNCLAYITVDGSVRYQYSGNCLQQIPTSSTSYDSMVQAGIQLAAALIGGVAAGGAGAATAEGIEAGEISAEASTPEGFRQLSNPPSQLESASANIIQSMKPRVERNGSLGASSGQMGVQYPFIIRYLPNQSLPENYSKYHGYPSNMSKRLSSLSGFTVIEDIQLNGLPCTEGEHAEIMQWLKKGVII